MNKILGIWRIQPDVKGYGTFLCHRIAHNKIGFKPLQKQHGKYHYDQSDSKYTSLETAYVKGSAITFEANLSIKGFYNEDGSIAFYNRMKKTELIKYPNKNANII